MSQITGTIESKDLEVKIPRILNGKPTRGTDKLYGFTRNNYVVNDDGKYDAESVFFVETDKATYDSIQDPSLKTTRTQTVFLGGGVGIDTREDTKYYQAVAVKDFDSRVWNATDNTGAGLRYSLGEWNTNQFKPGVFSTVSKASQDAVTKKVNREVTSGLQLKDNTGFSRDTPTSNDDNDEQNPTLLNRGDIDLAKLNNLTIKSKYTRKNFGDLRYPEDKTPYQDSIQFAMYEYVGGRNLPRYDFAPDGGGGSTTDRTLSNSPLGYVTLPVQTPIADTNTVGWGQGSMTPIQAYGMYAGLKANNFSDLVGNLLSTAEKVLTDTDTNNDLKTGVKTYLAGKAVAMRGALPRFTGAILNPNIELLFDKPQLRGFQFQFLLAARSEKEAATVKKIIRFFKQGMSVKETSSNIFLKSPNVFKIKYLFGINGGTTGEHPGLHKIKTCALTSCSVDYTPDGSYMTFEDGTMTAYRISLQFSELDPLTERDYQEYDRGAALKNLGPVSPEVLNTNEKNDAGGIGF